MTDLNEEVKNEVNETVEEMKSKIDEISNKSYENFIDGAKEYLEYLAKLRRTQDIQVKINAVRLHILPFFKKTKTTYNR